MPPLYPLVQNQEALLITHWALVFVYEHFSQAFSFYTVPQPHLFSSFWKIPRQFAHLFFMINLVLLLQMAENLEGMLSHCAHNFISWMYSIKVLYDILSAILLLLKSYFRSTLDFPGSSYKLLTFLISVDAKFLVFCLLS